MQVVIHSRSPNIFGAAGSVRLEAQPDGVSVSAAASRVVLTPDTDRIRAPAAAVKAAFKFPMPAFLRVSALHPKPSFALQALDHLLLYDCGVASVRHRPLTGCLVSRCGDTSDSIR